MEGLSKNSHLRGEYSPYGDLLFFFLFCIQWPKKKKKEEAKWLDEKRQLMTKVFSFRPWGKLELDFRLCLFYLTRKWKHLWK